jgi:hypothetical protein
MRTGDAKAFGYLLGRHSKGEPIDRRRAPFCGQAKHGEDLSMKGLRNENRPTLPHLNTERTCGLGARSKHGDGGTFLDR